MWDNLEPLYQFVTIILMIFGAISIPFTVRQTYSFLNKKLHNYNHKEKIIITTGIPSVGLAIALIGLAIAQFHNSIPTLLYIQNLAANSIPRAFPDLMWFGVISGIITSLVGAYLLKVHVKELRIVFSPK